MCVMIWSGVYITYFVLNSTEHEISITLKTKLNNDMFGFKTLIAVCSLLINVKMVIVVGN